MIVWRKCRANKLAMHLAFKYAYTLSTGDQEDHDPKDDEDEQDDSNHYLLILPPHYIFYFFGRVP